MLAGRKQAVLHESWFLPPGVLALFLGVLLLIYAGARKFVGLVKRRRGQQASTPPGGDAVLVSGTRR